jgi:hypothetical protein
MNGDLAAAADDGPPLVLRFRLSIRKASTRFARRQKMRADDDNARRYAASSLFAARAGNMPGQPRTLSISLTVTNRQDG